MKHKWAYGNPYTAWWIRRVGIPSVLTRAAIFKVHGGPARSVGTARTVLCTEFIQSAGSGSARPDIEPGDVKGGGGGGETRPKY